MLELNYQESRGERREAGRLGQCTFRTTGRGAFRAEGVTVRPAVNLPLTWPAVLDHPRPCVTGAI